VQKHQGIQQLSKSDRNLLKMPIKGSKYLQTASHVVVQGQIYITTVSCIAFGAYKKTPFITEKEYRRQNFIPLHSTKTDA
jgi:hypothetical protein